MKTDLALPCKLGTAANAYLISPMSPPSKRCFILY